MTEETRAGTPARVLKLATPRCIREGVSKALSRADVRAEVSATRAGNTKYEVGICADGAEWTYTIAGGETKYHIWSEHAHMSSAETLGGIYLRVALTFCRVTGFGNPELLRDADPQPERDVEEESESETPPAKVPCLTCSGSGKILKIDHSQRHSRTIEEVCPDCENGWRPVKNQPLPPPLALNEMEEQFSFDRLKMV